LLKTFPTVYGPALRGLEGNRGFLAALRAYRGGLDTLAPVPAQHVAPLGLTGLAPLRFILETFVSEKELLAGSKNELCSAIATLEDPIPVFHAQLPWSNRASSVPLLAPAKNGGGFRGSHPPVLR
jgi:hypothetical protein